MARPFWQTRVSERLGLRYPIFQGPFGGGLSTPALVAAVTEAGGLGSFGLEGFAPTRILEAGSEIRARTSGPFALNLWVPLPGEETATLERAAFDRAMKRIGPIYAQLGEAPPTWDDVRINPTPPFLEQVDALLEVKPPIASFIFGVPPEPVLHDLRRQGIISIGTATNVVEGEALDAAGIDIIVVSGSEAGGHRAAFLRTAAESLTTSALVMQLAGQVAAPVVAAGGIADGRGAVAAFVLGAEAVQVGTAFLVSHESGAAEVHKSAITAPGERSTVLTTAFTGRHARGLINRYVREIGAAERDILPFPWQYLITKPLRVAAARLGKTEWMSLWAGQNAPLVSRRSAADVLQFLVDDTERVLTDQQSRERTTHA